jgi:hypothetical protein
LDLLDQSVKLGLLGSLDQLVLKVQLVLELFLKVLLLQLTHCLVLEILKGIFGLLLLTTMLMFGMVVLGLMLELRLAQQDHKELLELLGQQAQ